MPTMWQALSILYLILTFEKSNKKILVKAGNITPLNLEKSKQIEKSSLLSLIYFLGDMTKIRIQSVQELVSNRHFGSSLSFCLK